MPELPEVEITARRIDAAVRGAAVESVLAPGMNVMKTFDPPLEALVGREITAVRRIAKMPVVEFGDLSLLIHLMSAGRLKAFDKRASPKDRASRVLMRLEDGRELRLREFGTKQRAWAKLLGADAVAADEMVASLGPEAWPPPPLEEFAAAIDQPRHLHPLLRHQRDIAGIDHYEETIGAELPDKVPMPLRVHRREGEPCPRCGTTIEAVFFSEHQMNYCPKEQTGGRVLKDRRLSKLLK